ncbi:hypothetical protein AHAS_Ahas05G0025900 [Arachis hypogaea]
MVKKQGCGKIYGLKMYHYKINFQGYLQFQIRRIALYMSVGCGAVHHGCGVSNGEGIFLRGREYK